MKRLSFSIVIAAPRARVWDTMLDATTYTAWTEPFGAGCYYEGSWDTGARIRFLASNGNGMTSEIAENRRHEFVSIRHLGFIQDGVEDTESDAIRSWAPSYENYALLDVGGATEVRVELDVAPEWETVMSDTWPKALARLKEICESGAPAAGGDAPRAR